MPLPGIELAKMIAKNINVPVQIVWPIIKNLKTTDFGKLLLTVKKALRM